MKLFISSLIGGGCSRRIITTLASTSGVI